MVLALADVAALEHRVLVRYGLFAVERLRGQRIGGAVVLCAADIEDTLDALRLDLLDVELALAADADDVGLFAVHAVFLDELVEAVCIARLQKDERLTLELRALDHVLAQVRAAETVVHEIRFQILRRLKVGGLRIVRQVADPPAEDSNDGSIRQKLFCAVDYFLHLKSSSLTFLPSEVIFSTNSFMVWENFTPSAAETHSTRVRPCSTPM